MLLQKVSLWPPNVPRRWAPADTKFCQASWERDCASHWDCLTKWRFKRNPHASLANTTLQFHKHPESFVPFSLTPCEKPWTALVAGSLLIRGDYWRMSSANLLKLLMWSLWKNQKHKRQSMKKWKNMEVCIVGFLRLFVTFLLQTWVTHAQCWEGAGESEYEAEVLKLGIKRALGINYFGAYW